MADVSTIRTPNGVYHSVKDSRIPKLPESENVYLRGDGAWEVPVISTGNNVIFIDGGDHLMVKLPA